MKVQRIRVTFSRGEATKYITHLDVMRFWERALRRAELPVAYSEGFSPHAQIALAAPLPVGTTSDGELMDVFMAERIAPATVVEQISPQLPDGIGIVGAAEVGMALPALQADVRFAEYVVDVAAERCDHDVDVRDWKLGAGTDIADAIAQFMAADSIPWEHKREEETKSYDIRTQVDAVDIVACDRGGVQLRMRLKNDSSGSGRPEQVVAALALPPPTRIHRTKLILAGASPALEAWRKHGRFAV